MVRSIYYALVIQTTLSNTPNLFFFIIGSTSIPTREQENCVGARFEQTPVPAHDGGGVCSGSSAVRHFDRQGVRVAVLALHGEPEAPRGVPRRPQVLHDRQGADRVQVSAD